jgi:hypothetical protein
LNGYSDSGDDGLGKRCSGRALYSSAGWELVNPGEDRVQATSFDDPYYQKYQRRAAYKCNEDDRCKYVTVWKDGGYRTYTESQCKDTVNQSNATTWKKVDGTVAAKDLPSFSQVSPQKINGYTALVNKSIKADDKFSWRNPPPTDTGLVCETRQYLDKYEDRSSQIDIQGPEVSYDSDEYKKYVKNAQNKCELEHNCNFISVRNNGGGEMYSVCEGQRMPPFNRSTDHDYKIFKRDDDQPLRLEPPPEIGAGLSNSEKHAESFMGYNPVSRYKKCNNHGSALANEYLRKEGEEEVSWRDFFSYKYQTLLKRGIELCNKDKNCQYLELNGSKAIARTFKKSDCKDPHAVHLNVEHKIWEKTDWKDPDIQGPIHGYAQYGSKFQSCGTNSGTPEKPEITGFIKQGSVKGSRDLGSQPATSFFKADGTMNDTYSEYLKQGAKLCNDDPNCKYVSVWTNGSYRTFGASACEDQPMLGYSGVKTWKKEDSSVAGTPEVEEAEVEVEVEVPVKHGYKNIHNLKMCPQDKQKWVKYSGSTQVGFQSTEYDNNLKSGISKCNADENCKYVTLFMDGLTGLVNEGECDSPNPVQNAKIWEKVDPNVIPAPPPPSPPPPPKPPPFSCGGNANVQIEFDRLGDGICDCPKPYFDDEGVDENGVAKGACKPHELGSFLNHISMFGTDYTAQQISSTRPAKTKNWTVAKSWDGGYTGNYETGYTANTQTETITSQLPYLIDEDKSGWTKKVFTGKSIEQCKQISIDHPRSPGYSYFVKGINGKGTPQTYSYYEYNNGVRGNLVTRTINGNQEVCVVYGGNTGKGTDKKCVTDHVDHPECWEREPTEEEKSYNIFKPGSQGTFWNWGFLSGGEHPKVWDGRIAKMVNAKYDLPHREWKKDKYWT